MINVKAASIRHGLSRFWHSKISTSSLHSNILSIYISEIFKDFFQADESIALGFAYDHSIIHFFSTHIDVSVFFQDSKSEELRYITDGNYSRKFSRLFFHGVKYRRLRILRKKNRKFLMHIFKKIRFSTLLKFKDSRNESYPSRPQFQYRIKNFNNFNNFIPGSKFLFSQKIQSFKMLFKKRRYFYLRFKIRDNRFRDFFFNFSRFSLGFKNFNYTSNRQNRFNSKLFKFFLQSFFIKQTLGGSKKSDIARFSFFSKSFLNFNFFNKRIRRSYKAIKKFNRFSNYPSFSFSLFSEKTYKIFINRRFKRTLFAKNKRYSIFKRRKQIKYIRRKTLKKNLFFLSSISTSVPIFRFLSSILSSFLFSKVRIRKVSLFRLKYYMSNAAAFTFYSIVKLYYKYILNDVIKPIIRGVSRYYKGIFVLCKGRFTRAQMASKRLYRLRFINYNRLYMPIHYSIGSVALRYGSSTVHIWLQH